MRNMSGYERLRRETPYQPTSELLPRYPSEDTLIVHNRRKKGEAFALLGQKNDYANKRRVYVIQYNDGAHEIEESTFSRAEADDIFGNYVRELSRL